jgi:hypothetical protein
VLYGTTDSSGFANAGSTYSPLVVVALQSWLNVSFNRLKFECLPSDLCRFAFRQVTGIVAQQCPRYSGVFVRQSNSDSIFMLSCA